ncbi:hypothetical protein GCM10009557_59940 [Virgisporangium ochraceum]|uniref:Uncharacterized protein n=1 Tax=Virgisporangium ochraceum TaxID=65505 RepID=A0A8J4EHD7_9ACTN|nr:hypothetical protein [Virgisporangium ochraceum]GIJ74874.1 hypothetical protein Voc01_097910 [Virgisporangium ochraceum]
MRDGWESACLRYRHLATGGNLAEHPPQGGLRLLADESSYSEAMLGYARFYGHNPTDLFIAAGPGIVNRAVGRRVDEMATPAWRDHTQARSVLTDRRILVDAHGHWRTFPHDRLLELTGDGRWTFVMRFEGDEPLMLYGPWAPFFMVATAWLLYGPGGLRLPALAGIAAAERGWAEHPDSDPSMPPGDDEDEDEDG